MRKFLLVSVAALSATIALRAQNVSDLIIAEVLAEPDSVALADDYGRREGWIELYNTSMGTVKYGGCFLTDDPSDLRKSVIPKGDLRTQLGPRQSVVFFASGRTHDGTFYTDFTLEPGKTVYLVSNDGRTVIDSITIPADLPAGKSVARLPNDAKGLTFDTVSPCEPTPGAYNGDPNAATKAEQMAERDPHGWILTLVSVGTVFCALAILWFMFWLLFDRRAKRRAAAIPGEAPSVIPGEAKESRRGDKPAPKAAKGTPDGEIAAAIALALDMEQDGDTYAAIALALHLYLAGSAHDAESFVLTMRPAGPSQWNERVQGFRRKP